MSHGGGRPGVDEAMAWLFAVRCWEGAYGALIPYLKIQKYQTCSELYMSVESELYFVVFASIQIQNSETEHVTVFLSNFINPNMETSWDLGSEQIGGHLGAWRGLLVPGHIHAPRSLTRDLLRHVERKMLGRQENNPNDITKEEHNRVECLGHEGDSKGVIVLLRFSYS